MDDIDNMDYPLPSEGQIVHSPEFGNVRYVESNEIFRRWVCLYPIYFDAERSSRNGRKVPKELAYPKPDIRAIREAVRRLRLSTAIEPQKVHPRDFGVYGRVRVQLTVEGRPVNPLIPDRKTLLREVAKLLQEIQPGLPPAPDNVPPEWVALKNMFSAGTSASSGTAGPSDSGEASTKPTGGRGKKHKKKGRH